MRDDPTADEILAAVATYLRAPASDPERAAFEDRVVANAVELARRDLTLGPVAEVNEFDRLQALLGDGSLDALNTELGVRLRSGAFDLASPGVREHLWATTLDKLAIDQPRYPTYRAVLTEREASTTEET